MQGVVRNITATATHPTKPHFILAGATGRLQLWDLITQTLVNSHKLPSPASITCIRYSHDGMVLAMGTSTGVVRICKEAECELVADFRPVKQVSADAQHQDCDCHSCWRFTRRLSFAIPAASVLVLDM